MENEVSEFAKEYIDILCCPSCNGDIKYVDGGLSCSECHHDFTRKDGIECLFWPNEWGSSRKDVTEKMKSFYEENPFPNYDEMDDIASLEEKASKSLFGKLLGEQVPFNTRILECGCGTGQLTNYLSIANRRVIGTDLCLNSLKLANQFKEANDLVRADFVQMNLFRPAFKARSFDLVISNGVLHHTSDPFLGFKEISNLVKPNGYLLLGLYHKYGRLFTDLRRLIFSFTRNRFTFLDGRVYDQTISKNKRKAWFMDQYKNPHESKHNVSEVLRWLDEVGFTFVSSIPKTAPFKKITPTERLFKEDRLGSKFERCIADLGCIFDGKKEGGFFTVIAKRIE